ncbi:IgA peptidase M64-domain-containing protein [Globomyces pollinis-pini]|nr:IgA peptidase M64-domain-containing protein [Globomyces pollinis-pini]
MLKICNSIEWYDDLETLSADAEVIPISISGTFNFNLNLLGDPVNRIDVVFMGDGYTSAERERFIADITRLYKDMWSSVTFESYLPLFNIWAVFVPSNESGIGSGGKPKDTAFGLYRDGTELRGIYTTKRSFARKVCKVTGEFACDYPSLIGNDEYYGGLGGEFVISTRSKTSGTVVLRHEMGHKYDGGQVYSGVNAVKSLEKIPWKEWLTEPNHIREEKEILLVQECVFIFTYRSYSWYDLGKGPYVIDFKSDGKYDRWSLQISSSGVEQDGSLEVYLDGRQLEWKSSGILDRTFSHWDGETGLAAGPHKLVFKQGFPPSGKDSPIRQLCSVSLHEFANQSLFQSDPNFIGAFPTFDLYGRKTYRPTNDACLMRNMSRNRFCTVCQEGLWLNLLTRISFIDKLEQTCEGGLAKISLKPLPVAQFRKLSLSYVNETLHVRWYKQGVHQQDFDDNFDLELPKATVGEKWKVTVDFKRYLCFFN